MLSHDSFIVIIHFDVDVDFLVQVKEDLLPEQHRGILVEQLNDILRQLQLDPTKIPVVHFTPEEVGSPTRDKKERNDSGSKVLTLIRNILK